MTAHTCDFDCLGMMSKKFAKQYYAKPCGRPAAPLTQEEKDQIRGMYLGLTSFAVMVTSGEVGFYSKRPNQNLWELELCGVPVLVGSKARSGANADPKLELYLAERGSGLLLWSTFIHPSDTDYVQYGGFIHFPYKYIKDELSIGFRFSSVEDCRELTYYIEIMKSFVDTAVSRQQYCRPSTRKVKKPRRLRKRDISSPCQVVRVTSMSLADTDRFFSLQMCLPYTLKEAD